MPAKLETIANEMIAKSEALGYEMEESVILKAKDELLDILLN